MTAVDTHLSPPVSTNSARDPAPSGLSWQQQWDARLDWLSEKLNPIVVKEARQALKSRQFTVTFGLLLVFGACWTALGVSLQMPAVFHTPSGPFMVVGYYIILAVPLLVIVPFAAFRSLAAEREDGTFDLLSIATLSARQVVVGKLASAVLQMMVYYSAIAPCIAFTYLLRGLDIITIGLMLAYLFLASTALSALGLALATVTKERHWQVLLSVVLVAGLVICFGMWLMFMATLFFELFLNSSPFDQPDFWMLNIAIVMFHVTFVALFILIAAGQISFATDNRSTPVRWVLLVQTAFWFGWMMYGMFREDYGAFFVLGASIALTYWWAAGSLLVGERADLTPRVRRQLPQSFVGRMFLTWLNPGSGTGYFFTLLNLGMLLIAFCLAENLIRWIDGRASSGVLDSGRMWRFAAAAWFFAAIYLGIGRLLVLAVRNRVPSGVVFSLLLQIVLVTFGTLIPLVVQLSLIGTTNFDYTTLQITNPFWTLVEFLFEYNSIFTDLEMVFGILGLTSVAMLILQFVLTIREVEQTRIVAPQRVQEEDAAEIAAHTPVRKKNPWDEPANAQA